MFTMATCDPIYKKSNESCKFDNCHKTCKRRILQFINQYRQIYENEVNVR